MLFLIAGSPTVSGMTDMDYPLQGPGLLSIPNLPEISSVRRVPLPPELVEQFGRILMTNNVLGFVCNSTSIELLHFYNYFFPNTSVRLLLTNFDIVYILISRLQVVMRSICMEVLVELVPV